MTYVELDVTAKDLGTCVRCGQPLAVGLDTAGHQGKPKWRLARFYQQGRLRYPIGFQEHASHNPCLEQGQTGDGPCLAHKVPLSGPDDPGPEACLTRLMVGHACAGAGRVHDYLDHGTQVLPNAT